MVGEMRGPEANAAQEAARTGVAVVTTIHSMSCEATYRRMVSLCKRAVDMSDETCNGSLSDHRFLQTAGKQGTPFNGNQGVQSDLLSASHSRCHGSRYESRN